MEIIIFGVIVYAVYCWGVRVGQRQGHKAAYQNDVLMRMEEFLETHDAKG